jgi:hypothetical protein
MPTCFLVLGVPRSGTSLVSAVLHRLGVSFAPWKMVGEGWHPRDESYEDAELEQWGDKFLDENLQPKDPAYYAQLQLLICQREAAAIDWGISHYYLNFVVDKFLAACSMPVKLLRTQRPLKASIASYAARLGVDTDIERTILDVDKKLSEFLDRSSLPILTIEFNRLIDEPESEVTRIASFIGREPAAAAIENIDPAWRRF